MKNVQFFFLVVLIFWGTPFVRLIADAEAEWIARAIESIESFHRQQFPLGTQPCVDPKTLKLLVHEKRKDFLSRFVFDFEVPLYEVKTKEELLPLLKKLREVAQKKKKSFQAHEEIATTLLQKLKKKPKLVVFTEETTAKQSHLSYFYQQAQNETPSQELYWEVRRIQDLYRWMIFELEVLEKNLEILQTFVEKHLKGIWRKGIIAYPGGNGILTRSRDFAEIQRQLQDQMLIEDTEKILLHQKISGVEGYGVLLPQRAFFYRLMEHFKGSRVEDWFRESLKKSYDLSYINHLLWRYREDHQENQMIRVLENYIKRSESTTRIGMLEVLFYRAGAFQTSHHSSDRFIEEIWSYSQKLDLQETRQNLYLQAAQMTQTITRPMRYGTSNTLRFAFDQQTVDCLRSSNICGAILANAGVDQVYPIFLSHGGGTHALTCILEKDQFWAIDTGAGQTDIFSFPRRTPSRETPTNNPSETFFMEENYYRGLAAWVNWKIFLSYAPQLVEIEIPYLENAPK